MAIQTFALEGDTPNSSIQIDTSDITDVSALKEMIGRHYGIVQPDGLTFQANSNQPLDDISSIQACTSQITLLIDDSPVRPIPGPTGLPFIGNYFEIYPDHIGNHTRLFNTYGPLIRTQTMGQTNTLTNSPDLAQIFLAESEYFSKEIVPGHPLYPIKSETAGVFLGDTSSPAWKTAHKFLAPAFGPKAVRNYARTMNTCLEESFPIFDALEKEGSAWNVYQYMLKLSAGTVGKLMLGKDLHHFDSIDAPLHRLVQAMGESLIVSKRIAGRGSWYGYLPLGDPKRLKELFGVIGEELMEAINTAQKGGDEDLPLQDAALKAENVIDYLSRATDTAGAHLPLSTLPSALTVATGAGFTTTSSLLSWCIHILVSHPNLQNRLLQELVDSHLSPSEPLSATDLDADSLPELDKFVKETQRMHNPAFQPSRTAQQDLVLPGGYRLRKGDVVTVAVHHVMNASESWTNPSRFDMDRWDTATSGGGGGGGGKKGAYIPFATGPRKCIAPSFAHLEIKLFIARLIWRYEFRRESYGGKVATEYDPSFQLVRPINLYVSTWKRRVWPTESWVRQG